MKINSSRITNLKGHHHVKNMSLIMSMKYVEWNIAIRIISRNVYCISTRGFVKNSAENHVENSFCNFFFDIISSSTLELEFMPHIICFDL